MIKKTKKQKTKKTKGFTLVEVLVAMSIFSIASLVISNIFLNANNLQQNIASLQRLQNEGRYLMEKIAREVRAREIKYPLSGQIINPQSFLDFKNDEYGEEVTIALNGNNLEYRINGVSSNLNASDVEVLDAKFYVFPEMEEKWGSVPITNVQSRVMVIIKIKNKLNNPKYQKELTLQTTISSKVYKR